MLEEKDKLCSRRKFLTRMAVFGASLILPETLLNPPSPVVRTLDGPFFDENDLAITVDDCFQAEPLRKILDVVEQNQIRITIFPVAKVFFNDQIREQLLRAAKLYCYFGNHTFSHPILQNLSEQQIIEETIKADKVFEQYLPPELVLPIFRPPCGYRTLRTDQAVGKTGKNAIILWSCTTGSTGSLATKEGCL